MKQTAQKKRNTFRTLIWLIQTDAKQTRTCKWYEKLSGTLTRFQNSLLTNLRLLPLFENTL